MIYKNFRINIIFRIALMIVSIAALFYTASQFNIIITPILISIFIVIQIVSMINYVDKTNRDLANFLESIRFSEFTRTFHIEGMGQSFNELSKAFNDVIQEFKKVRSEKEEHFQYLQSIVQNIDVSIIAYQKDGTVEMVNKAAKKLFQVNSMKNINVLSKKSSELVSSLINLKPGENTLIKIHEKDDILQLVIYGTEFKINDRIIILSTIKNIQNELEEQETEAWQKLISVLTHEIMNSITPITSLSSTVEGMIRTAKTEKQEDPERVEIFDDETTDEVHMALKTIHKRSSGLLDFVNTYRNLTRIPKPDFKIMPVRELLEDLLPLFEEEAKTFNVKTSISVSPDDLNFSIDTNQIEQVLINLVKNAVHALADKDNGVIEINSFLNQRGRVTIQVIDNGKGILPDVLDKIFIPFFTTKKQGSGVGLSLSRQIMRLHGGSINVHSVIDEGTTFTLTF
jgi:nitrogen fixation/metabolism regulation signal transduction histidine kinase